MARNDDKKIAGRRWIDYGAAAAAQSSGRAARMLARWDSAEESQRAVMGVVSEVLAAATSVRSGHEWAERIVEIHYPDAASGKRHAAVQALRLHTLLGVQVGWNTALSVVLAGDGVVSNVAEAAAAQAFADRIYRAVVGGDPDDERRGGSRRPRGSDLGGSTLSL